MMTLRRIRQVAGVVVKDLPRYLPALATGRGDYLALRNRAERLVVAPDRSGFRCDWRWTSELYAPKVIAGLGLRLMRRALADHPIRRALTPVHRVETPQISFLIGHRGTARLPHLLATLESIAGQENVDVECIVVDQDTDSELAVHLPRWVRHIHAEPPRNDMPYCRSWAFNIAARHARAPVLVLHDNDMMVPTDYSAQILRRTGEGYQVINLKRFIFYLSQSHTEAVFASKAALVDAAPEAIVQNNEGGGSVAITCAGYSEIGGMDESFIGWGGEDNEFWERAATLRVWPWANLPLVHLYHAAQPEKHSRSNPTAGLYEVLAQIPASERIRQLRQRAAGRLEGPISGAAALSRGENR